MIIIILGPPGSGKGTVSYFISRQYNIVHIAPGRMLRLLAKTTEYGKQLKEKYWGKGDLVPDEIVVDLVRERIDNSKKGFIFDGFPRDINQAKAIKSFIKPDFVFLLELSEKTIVERLHDRVQCAKCGHVYHLKHMPPKKEGICDIDGGKLYIRSDDKDEAIIKERIKVFNEEIKPLVEHYKEVLQNVNADQSLDKLLEEINSILRR